MSWDKVDQITSECCDLSVCGRNPKETVATAVEKELETSHLDASEEWRVLYQGFKMTGASSM